MFIYIYIYIHRIRILRLGICGARRTRCPPFFLFYCIRGEEFDSIQITQRVEAWGAAEELRRREEAAAALVASHAEVDVEGPDLITLRLLLERTEKEAQLEHAEGLNASVPFHKIQ